MCVDAMVAEDRRQRADRPSWPKLAKRRFLCVNMVKATVRRYVEKRGKSNGRLCRTSGPQTGLSSPEVPPGAMAPRNTTQYLMELAYSDLLNTSSQRCFNDTERRSSSDSSGQREPDQTPEERFYSSVFSEEERMDFQQRDFEAVCLHEL